MSEVSAVARAFGVGVACALIACTVPADLLDDQRCPCLAGWRCDPSTDRCARAEDGGRIDSALDARDTDPPLDTGGIADSRAMDSAADAGLPPIAPPVDQKCWISPGMCDWSGSFGFELGDQSMIMALSTHADIAFSPDGCELYYRDSPAEDIRVARRVPGGNFGPGELIEGIDRPSYREFRASISPNGRELFFGSNLFSAGEVQTVRAERESATEPWGSLARVDNLTVPLINNWDGCLAPHGLRFYWSPTGPGGQEIRFAERPSWDAEFGPGAEVPELVAEGGQAEPSVTADGLTIVYSSSAPAFGSVITLVYARRDSYLDPFGPPTEVPGAFLAMDVESESAVSPDGCEILIKRGGRHHYLTYR